MAQGHSGVCSKPPTGGVAHGRELSICCGACTELSISVLPSVSLVAGAWHVNVSQDVQHAQVIADVG